MSDHDPDRDGGGLAVLVIGGILAVLLLLGIGGGIFLFRRLAVDQRIAVEQAEIAADEAAAAAVPPPIETPAPSAPESPEPTQ